MKKILLTLVLALISQTPCFSFETGKARLSTDKVKASTDFSSQDSYLTPKGGGIHTVSEICEIRTSSEMTTDSTMYNDPELFIKKRKLGPEHAKILRRVLVREKKQRELFLKRMTADEKEFIRQQRKLAENYCHLEKGSSRIILEISQEDAAILGIEANPYTHFAKWVDYVNDFWGRQLRPEEVLAYYEIRFDDYQKESIISNQPRK